MTELTRGAGGTTFASFQQEAIMLRAALLAVAFAATTACAAKADLATATQVERVMTGWMEPEWWTVNTRSCPPRRSC